MDSYEVVIQPEAQKNLTDITFHVSQILQSPLAAINLEIELTEAILSLDQDPCRAPKFSETFSLSDEEDIRKLVVENYLILFFVDEKHKQINIVSVHHHLRETGY